MSNRAFIIDWLNRLCRVPRPAGSPLNKAIASELHSYFQSLGLTTDIDAHEFVGWELRADPIIVLEAAGEQRIAERPLPVVWSAGTSGEVVGVIPAGDRHSLSLLTFEAYPWNVLAVVAPNGREIARLLTGDPVWPQPLDGPSDLPHVMLRPVDAAWIDRHLSRGQDVTVRLRLECRHVPARIARNVVAHRPATDWPPRVLVSAHYDSFPGSPGAHDNASGLTAMLSVAAGQTAPDVGFAAFDAEEWNKLGSERHAADLQARGLLDRIELMINLDSVGIGEQLYLLASPGLGERIRQVCSLHASIMLLSSFDNSASQVLRLPSGRLVFCNESEAFPQFDTWPFMKRGVPVIQIGSTGAVPFRHWHTPEDRLERIGESGRELIEDTAALVSSLLEVSFEPDSRS